MDTENGGSLSQLYLLRDYQSKRSSSWDKSGGNQDWVRMTPGKTEVLRRQVLYSSWMVTDPGAVTVALPLQRSPAPLAVASTFHVPGGRPSFQKVPSSPTWIPRVIPWTTTFAE